MRLDRYDVQILVELQREGRMTKVRLAERIGLSPSPCWERLRRLEEAGVIRGYHAEVDLARVVGAETILVDITLRAHEAADFERFERAIRALPEVVECYAVGGGVDYKLKVVALDLDHYQRLLDGLLEADVGIHRYFTYVVTKPIKDARGWPLRRLLEGAGRRPRR